MVIRLFIYLREQCQVGIVYKIEGGYKCDRESSSEVYEDRVLKCSYIDSCISTFVFGLCLLKYPLQ
jgi:hypothetical protein